MDCFLYVTHEAWDFSGFFFPLNAFVIPLSLATEDDRLQRLRNCCWRNEAEERGWSPLSTWEPLGLWGRSIAARWEKREGGKKKICPDWPKSLPPPLVCEVVHSTRRNADFLRLNPERPFLILISAVSNGSGSLWIREQKVSEVPRTQHLVNEICGYSLVLVLMLALMHPEPFISTSQWAPQCLEQSLPAVGISVTLQPQKSAWASCSE